MRNLLVSIATMVMLLSAPSLASAEARVVLPRDDSKILVFPHSSVASCVVYDMNAPGGLRSTTAPLCRPFGIHSVRVEGTLYLLNRPEAAILAACEDVGCFIINTETN